MRLFLLLIFFNQSVLAWVSVGSTPGFGVCDFVTIQEAIDSNEPEIRVVGQNFTENLVINTSIDIKGSYSSCTTTSLGDLGLSNNNTVIKGEAIIGESTIKINSSLDAQYNIQLSNLTIRDATDTLFVSGGHGIEIGDSSVSLSINNSLIINNSAEDGGGIYIGKPENAEVFIKDTSVLGNVASNRGGGIYCENENTTIRIIDQSLVGENNALDGGGIFATNGCKVIIDSGVDVDNSSDLRGIMGNIATNNGGGIYADLAAEIYLYGNIYNGNPLDFPFIGAGNSTHPVTLANNQATNHGGGLYANRNTTVLILDGLITNNISSSLGGGFYISDNSELNIKRSEISTCWSSENKCSTISNNKSTVNGGGIYVENESQINVESTYIYGNRANLGTAVYAIDNNTSVNLLNDVIYENGQNGLNGYNDIYVIRGHTGPIISVYHSTIVDNDVNNSDAIFGMIGQETVFVIENSIVFNESEFVLIRVLGALNYSTCVLANETNTLTGDGVINLNPGFVDSINNDYRLSNDSEAIDYCMPNESIESLTKDIDNNPRPFDFADIPNNAFGIADAGAYEYRIPEIIFKNGFE